MRYIMQLNMCFFKINDPPTNSQTPKCWSQGFRLSSLSTPCLAGSMLAMLEWGGAHPMYTQRSMNHHEPLITHHFMDPMCHSNDPSMSIRHPCSIPTKTYKNWSTGTHEPRPFQEDLRFLRGFPIFCHQNISVWDIFPRCLSLQQIRKRRKNARWRARRTIWSLGALFGALVGRLYLYTGSKW